MCSNFTRFIHQRVLVTIITIFSLFMLSCNFPFFSSEEGAITLNITQQVSSGKTLLPDIGMNPASYRVSGTGPSGATFTPVTIVGNSTSIEKLAAGSWAITVDAYNSDVVPAKIGTGSATVTVTNGTKTDAAIVVKPLAGNGTLSINISWPDNVLVDPQVVATLKPTVGSDQPLVFSLEANSARYISNTIAAGYYTLGISLNEGTTNVTGKSEIVRIVAGQTTSGTYTFMNLNPAGGTASVSITPELAPPFVVSIDGGQPKITIGTSITLSAVISNYVGTTTYAWYVNGIAQNINSEKWTCGSTWKAGIYTIDVMVVSSDGTQAGSATLDISVEPNVYAGGYSKNSAGISIPGYWKNGTWVELPSLAWSDSQVKSIVVSGSDVYAGGWAKGSSGHAIAGYWKNGTWIDLPSLDSNRDAFVNDIVVSDADVYACGTTDNSLGIPTPCYWKNGMRVGLPTLSTNGSWAYEIVVADGDVYVCGTSQNSSNIYKAGYWKNGTWVELSAPTIVAYPTVNCLTVSDNDVYAGGGGVTSENKTISGYWKNSTWTSINSLYDMDSWVYSIVVANGDIYLSGCSKKSEYVLTPGYWKNGSWIGLTPLSNDIGQVYSLAVMDNFVYAGGYSEIDGAQAVPGYWKNATWTGLPQLSTSQQSAVNTIVLQ